MDLSAESLFDSVRYWAEVREDVRALAIVGSHARGDARPDSDVDLIVVCSEPTRYLRDTAWVSTVSFLSPQLFLEGFDRNAPACLVLDLELPGYSGLELQRTLEQEASALPIIFLTGRGDIATSVQAMKHGATDFLTKPVDDTDLITAVRDALARDEALRLVRSERARVAYLLSTLTEREREVLERIVAGRLNKQIAADLGTSEKTIKFHRGNLMRKMGVRVVAELVKIAERAGVGGGSGA